MRLLKNSGQDRVIDVLRQALTPNANLDIASPDFSLFAFAELRSALERIQQARWVIPHPSLVPLAFQGSDADRAARNRLQTRWLARQCAEWLEKKSEIRSVRHPLPQSVMLVRPPDFGSERALSGSCPFTTEGLGLTPGNPFSLIQCSESPTEWEMLHGYFASLWSNPAVAIDTKAMVLASLQSLIQHQPTSAIYHFILYHLFKDLEGTLDEERIVKSATGIRNTEVWKRLYKFQRDGAIGAIDKLERFGGCIIADSVGLGKTFEALAIIKYYELRNDRVLVLCPKRLRDNWTLYKTNDRRNILHQDRFHYDVLNHTDLSRKSGSSGDIDLANVNWGNYDLVVIDESHNFRNKLTHKGRESRYDRLMKEIIQSGVKTRVLMLSATPVNNRLADLKNQIAFATEGNDAALADHGIANISATVRKAQIQFNRWLDLPEPERKPTRLLDMLGFDYFKLLDLLTIARSRKHIERYYGTQQTGRFPERLKPLNFKPDVDRHGEFRPIREINDEIRQLNLAAYAPLRYILPHKQAAYDARYSEQVRGGEGFFRQSDREESLIHLIRVNTLKRMESSVSSFRLTVERQLRDVETLLTRLQEFDGSIEELDIETLDIDDPTFETLLVGRKVKVLLHDVDHIRWRQELEEDRGRLTALLNAAHRVDAQRDAKLETLRQVISQKVQQPLNPGNRKVLIFTAFADTAQYLYEHLAPWAKDNLGMFSALVTGAGRNRTNLPGCRVELVNLLTSFSPRSKERPPELAESGEIDLLIATDCISEGQNLQDCDYLVNFDIHWNPVRIIQRFGRIDRLGSRNTAIQLVNFWPNMELEEYINLEQRVSGRMVLLDISATGEENLIQPEAGDQMNDLEYRRKQLLKLQETVIDLEDLESGISIADLTLNDFRLDLAGALRAQAPSNTAPRQVTSFPSAPVSAPDLDGAPLGRFAVIREQDGADSLPAGVIFCLRAVGEAALKQVEPGYPLTPHYLVHVGQDGSVLLAHTQVRRILDRLKRATLLSPTVDASATTHFDKLTRHGRDMDKYQRLLARAVEAIVGKKEERAIASLFSPGGTHVFKGEFAGTQDFEVVAYLLILAPDDGRLAP